MISKNSHIFFKLTKKKEKHKQISIIHETKKKSHHSHIHSMLLLHSKDRKIQNKIKEDETFR